MTFGNLQELFRGAGWLAAALFPLLQGTFRHTECRGKLGLRESALQPHTDNVRFGFNLCPLPSTGFDLPYAAQDFLSHIARCLEIGECFAGEFFAYFEMPLIM